MSPHDSASYYIGVAFALIALAIFGSPSRKQLAVAGVFFVVIALGYKFGYLS